jgi:hypothetical protein
MSHPDKLGKSASIVSIALVVHQRIGVVGFGWKRERREDSSQLDRAFEVQPIVCVVEQVCEDPLWQDFSSVLGC